MENFYFVQCKTNNLSANDIINKSIRDHILQLVVTVLVGLKYE